MKKIQVLILKFKSWVSYFCMLAVLMCIWLYSFGIIVPYLLTHDFNQIWPANKGSEGKKIILFCVSWLFWVYSPTLISVFRGGDLYFFKNYVEHRPYLPLFKKRIIFLKDLHIKIRNGRGMLLTNTILPKWWKAPYEYWKLVSLYGFAVPFSGIGLKNPKSLQDAIKIIQKNAKSTSNF